MNVYPFIEAEKAQQHNVTRACQLLSVSRSAYYTHRAGPSPRSCEDTELTQRIIAVHETLGRQTTGGRLVVLISHMRAITENIEHVLVVEKTLTGSHAHWASADERDQIITDDMAAGLLP